MLARDDTTGRFRCLALEEVAGEGDRSEGVLTVLQGSQPGLVYPLDLDVQTLGRCPDADIVLEDEGLSRIHARIARSEGGFVFEDMGSTNGSFVEGRRARGPMPLADGQRIYLGVNTVLSFSRHDQVELNAARMTRDLAMRDPLTRLYNRRHLNDRLLSEVAYARRHGVALSVLLVDLDRFKQVNDSLGHVTGDNVLREVSKTLQLVVRTEDVVARYGGEEFVIVARAIEEAGAMRFGERVREAIARMRMAGPGGPFSITTSIGIGHAPAGLVTEPAPLVQTADQALYRAKDEGRNRVVMLQPPHMARKSGVVPRT